MMMEAIGGEAAVAPVGLRRRRGRSPEVEQEAATTENAENEILLENDDEDSSTEQQQQQVLHNDEGEEQQRHLHLVDQRRLQQQEDLLEQRRLRNNETANAIAESGGGDAVAAAEVLPLPAGGGGGGGGNMRPGGNSATSNTWRMSHLYCVLSALCAILAIITAQNTAFSSSNTSNNSNNGGGSTTTTNSRAGSSVGGLLFESSSSNNAQQEQPVILKEETPNTLTLVQQQQQQKNQQQQPLQDLFFIDPIAWLQEIMGGIVSSFSGDAEKNEKDRHNDDDGFKFPPWLRWLSGGHNNQQEEKMTFESRASSKMKLLDSARHRLDKLLSSLLHPNYQHYHFNMFPFSIITVVNGVLSVLDPTLLRPSPSTLTDLIDKILTSTPRLLAIANLLLALTYLLHAAVADWFLGNNNNNNNGGTANTTTTGGGGAAATTTPTGGNGLNNNNNNNNNNIPAPDWAATAAAGGAGGRERLGGFLVFKLLLISAVLAPDTLDLLILLSWYTLLSFLRSLAHLCAGMTQHTSQSGQAPRPGVFKLLLVVLLSDFLAAAFCVALFHGAGWGMVLLLTCDCALLAVDVVCHILQHAAQVLDAQQGEQVSVIEAEQVRLHRRRERERESYNNNNNNSYSMGSLQDIFEDSIMIEAQNSNNNSSADEINADEDEAQVAAQLHLLDHQMEVLEQQHARRLSVLDGTVFGLQLLTHVLTVGHFIHIWSLHGVQFTLIDGVLALHLHSALSSASKKITERRNLYRIARDLDGMFENASELDLRKASASGDMCCICLGGMSTGNVKKVGCGHLYHTSCLREVVERARSMEAARCPLCRASVLDGRQLGNHNDRDGTRLRRARAGVDNLNGMQAGTDVVVPRDNNAVAGRERALFRFSSEEVFPAWLPLPAFSFEVVRRPTAFQDTAPAADPARNNNNINNNAVIGANNQQQQNNNQEPQGGRQSLFRRFLVMAGAAPMSPEEEAAAIEQLVDMFPQFDRSDLLRELRQRGSGEGVAESILAGTFAGVPRGGGFVAAVVEQR